MKIGAPPRLPPLHSAKEGPAKKSFKEICKEKTIKKEDVPSFNIYLPQAKLEVPPEDLLIELTRVITHAIENDTLATELHVKGTTIVIEQLSHQPGHLHIQITTQGDQFDLLQSHLGQLDLALKTALPHISCHLAPLQVHQSKNRPIRKPINQKWPSK